MKDHKELILFKHRFEKTFFNFHGDYYLFGGRDFKPYRENVKVENGLYITIRCGLTGIYTMLNEMKDGKWIKGVLDDSTIIAFGPLTKKEKEEYNNIINNLKNQ